MRSRPRISPTPRDHRPARGGPPPPGTGTNRISTPHPRRDLYEERQKIADFLRELAAEAIPLHFSEGLIFWAVGRRGRRNSIRSGWIGFHRIRSASWASPPAVGCRRIAGCRSQKRVWVDEGILTAPRVRHVHRAVDRGGAYTLDGDRLVHLTRRLRSRRSWRQRCSR
jgi:hypothetical protein